MNDLKQESDVRDYYQQLSLGDDRVNAILDAGELVSSARRWKQRAIAASVGMAAMTLLAIGLFIADRSGSANQSDRATQALAPPSESSSDSTDSTSDGRPVSVSKDASTIEELLG